MKTIDELCKELDGMARAWRRILRHAPTRRPEAHREMKPIAAKALALVHGGKPEDYL